MPSLGFLAALAMGLATVVAAATVERPEPHDYVCDHAGWYYYNDHCYLIDPIGTGNMTWQQAADFCPTAHAGRRAILLRIKTKVSVFY